MDILFLGTGAAEGIPSPFCECLTCRHARKHGGVNTRMRTATLFNADLLIDCGPDLVVATARFGISLSKLSTLLITHPHQDHFMASNLGWQVFPYRLTPIRRLRIFGPDSVWQEVCAFKDWDDLSGKGAMSFQVVSAGQSWQTGKYRITAVPAVHAGTRTALLYIVHDGARRVFYAADSGPFSSEAWEILEREAPFDAVLLEETMGHGETLGEHQSIDTFLSTHRRFMQEGWLAPDGQFIAFHFSHGGNPPHAELVEFFEPKGIRVASDGLLLTL